MSHRYNSGKWGKAFAQAFRAWDEYKPAQKEDLVTTEEGDVWLKLKAPQQLEAEVFMAIKHAKVKNHPKKPEVTIAFTLTDVGIKGVTVICECGSSRPLKNGPVEKVREVESTIPEIPTDGRAIEKPGRKPRHPNNQWTEKRRKIFEEKKRARELRGERIKWPELRRLRFDLAKTKELIEKTGLAVDPKDLKELEEKVLGPKPAGRQKGDVWKKQPVPAENTQIDETKTPEYGPAPHTQPTEDDDGPAE